MTKKYSQEELDQILLSKKLNEFYLAIIENRQELLTDEEYEEISRRDKTIYGDNKDEVEDLFKKVETDERLNLAYSTSMTTRKPRAGEVDGRDYFFSSREDFEKAIKEGGLLEWAEFVGNYYGTPLKEVNRLRDEGKNVLLEIEVQGAIQVQEKCPDAVSIFIIPPSMEELERRIRGRSTEPEEIIQQRLAKASNEMKMVSQYKYIVCNDDPKLAAELIKTIILRHVELEENK